jgi:hypothetical protein
MAAEIVDKWSGPLRAMNKSLRSLADAAKGTHQTTTAHVRDQAKAYGGLDRSVRDIADRTKNLLTPALAAAGVSILSVGGAVAALVKATNSFGETTKKLAFMSRETGFSIAKLRELDALASRVGTSPEAMRAGEQAFAHNMEQLRRWRGASAEFFTSGAGGEFDVGAGAGLKGSAFLKAQRARMAEELKSNPQLAATLRGLAVAEDAHDPEGVVEALANRAAYTHKSIRSLMYSGFYGPMNRGQVRPNNDPKIQAAIDRVWGGENRLQGATDQGTYGDPNARWPGGRIHPPGASRSAIYNDWGGGPGGHEGARLFRENQQRQVAAGGDVPRFAAMPHFTTRDIAKLRGPVDSFNDRWQGDLLQQGKRSDLDLLQAARRAGFAGATRHEVTGSGSLTVDFQNMPGGIRTAGSIEGMFKKLTLNRAASPCRWPARGRETVEIGTS